MVPEPGRLGEWLLREGILTQKQLDTAIRYHQSIGGHLGAILVKLGYVDDSVLTHYVARQQHVHEIAFDFEDIDPQLVKGVPRDLMEKHQVVPIKKEGDILTLGMADASDMEALEAIQFVTNCRIDPVLLPKRTIRKAFIHLFH